MKQFELTEDHIKLCSQMCIGWNDCEYGAPEVDPKRPYGNSDVEGDICEILGCKKVDVDYEEQYLTKDLKRAAKLHEDMKVVLQIILQTKSFELGMYEREQSYSPWRKV